MSRNCFFEVNSFLHFNDADREPTRGEDGFDRLYKVSPVISHVKSKCLTNFSHSQNISLMRVSVAFQGRLSFRQFMPVKPTKYGAALCKVDCFKRYHS